MDQDVKDAIAALNERIGTVEDVAANYIADHSGWLLALQAIAAVAIVRQTAAAADPQAFLDECRTWSRQIIGSTSAAPTLAPETAEKIRDTALAKIDGFFSGIDLGK